MNILKSRVLYSYAHRRCYSYFSNAFNELASQTPQFQRKPTIGNNLDFDVLADRDNTNVDFMESLLRLRKQKECSVAPLLPNIAVKRLLEHTSPQEVTTVLRNPLQFGVFIDEFTGCHLIDIMLNSGNAHEAAQVAAVLIERGLCKNELVASLSLQSFYSFLKNYTPKQQKKIEQNVEKEKVRVKFVRNNVNDTVKTEEQILGEAMISLSLDEHTGNLKDAANNIALLGFVISGRIEDAEKHLTQYEKIINKDILQLCAKLVDSLNGENSTNLKQQLDSAISQCTQNNTFSDILDSNVKAAVKNFEPKLVSEYTNNYKEWKTIYQSAIEKQSQVQDVDQRVGNIERTLAELQQSRQSLWFFENREDIDIAIYKKKTNYPKRWFGKKKKPKTVDAFYVPPSVSRVN